MIFNFLKGTIKHSRDTLLISNQCFAVDLMLCGMMHSGCRNKAVFRPDPEDDTQAAVCTITLHFLQAALISTSDFQTVLGKIQKHVIGHEHKTR